MPCRVPEHIRVGEEKRVMSVSWCWTASPEERARSTGRRAATAQSMRERRAAHTAMVVLVYD